VIISQLHIWYILKWQHCYLVRYIYLKNNRNIMYHVRIGFQPHIPHLSLMYLKSIGQLFYFFKIKFNLQILFRYISERIKQVSMQNTYRILYVMHFEVSVLQRWYSLTTDWIALTTYLNYVSHLIRCQSCVKILFLSRLEYRYKWLPHNVCSLYNQGLLGVKKHQAPYGFTIENAHKIGRRKCSQICNLADYQCSM
jgi:hypothetical protein